MRLRHVVTCFLLDPAGRRILLGKRSGEVHTYPGRWAAISGSVDDATPRRQAEREIREETGLGAADIRLVAEGMPVRFPAWDLGTVWVVHPFLFHCLNPNGARPDREHTRFEWVEPAQIESLETVPKLAEAFRAVQGFEGTCPTERAFAEVRDDRARGADELGTLTLQATRTAAGAGADATGERWLEQMRDLCRTAAGLRPSMASVRSAGLEAFGACRRALEESPDDPPGAAAAAVATLTAGRETASIEAAGAVARLIEPGTRVVTLSLSSTVLMALHDAAGQVAQLVVAESRPRCEGRETARLAAQFGIPTKLMTDAAAAGALGSADVLLFGADALTGGGDVVNKTGTLALCAAARHFGVRTLCAATPAKVLPEGRAPGLERMDRAELGEPIKGVQSENPYFEVVPAQLVGTIVLGAGEADREALAGRARLLAALERCLGIAGGAVSQ
jgi:translation initiation factor 2B subunit (eIF-2B alpha/beta/delta family)/8-oxo-dGTP pyrophosphatase MutT (NUDIX family)